VVRGNAATQIAQAKHCSKNGSCGHSFRIFLALPR
jgi:hypothetical protein